MRRRFLAALWYAIAALIPLAYLIGPSLRPSSPGLETWSDWLLLISPVICAAASGFIVGVRRRQGRPQSGWKSALRGLGAAAFAFLLVALLVGVITAVDEGDWSYVLLVPPFTLLYGGMRVGWLVLLVGAGAGWLFDRFFTPQQEGDAA